MTKKESLQFFETKKVRTIWDDEQEKWYFAIVDVVAVLTDSINPQSYWRKLKQRLKEEGNKSWSEILKNLEYHAKNLGLFFTLWELEVHRRFILR